MKHGSADTKLAITGNVLYIHRRKRNQFAHVSTKHCHMYFYVSTSRTWVTYCQM